MRHFVQYHNPDRYGSPGQPAPGGPYWVATRKPVNRLPGSCLWLILGMSRPRIYWLYEVFVIDRVEPFQDPDFLYRIAGQIGIRFGPALEVTFFPWFQAMKHRLGNFSLGLTEVTHTYAQTLISFAREQYPAFQAAFDEVDLNPGPGNIEGNSSGTGR